MAVGKDQGDAKNDTAVELKLEKIVLTRKVAGNQKFYFLFLEIEVNIGQYGE